VISVTAVRPRIPLRAAPIAPAAPTGPSDPTTRPTEPPASTAPEPIAPPTSAAPAGRAFTIVVAGDLLAHTSVIDQARSYAADGGYDFSPMLRKVQPIVAAADVAICHLETPVAPPGAPPDGSYPDYGVPAEITAAIASAGFDRCSLASNHAMDKGAAGVGATLDAFDAAGLGHAGMARTPAEAGPTLFTVGDTTVAHLSYTFSFNGRRLPKDQPWRSNLIDPARIVAEARQARQDGARFVVVSLHWGSEGSNTVTSSQRRWAEEITASGAVDVIVGHHAHVVQPIEQVNGRWVVFGLGNFLTGMGRSSPCCGVRGQDGMMVRLRVTEQPDGTFAVATPEAIATYVDRTGYVVLPVQLGLADPASAGAVGAGALTDSLGRTGAVVGSFLVPS
jgi:capsule synthesis protein PGA_cap